MRIWCDRCESLVEDEEVSKTSYGQFCSACWIREEKDVELTPTDYVIMELETKYPIKEPIYDDIAR